MAEEQNRTLSDKFMLRLPDGLRDRIAAEARRNGRSMNAEIVRVLEGHFPPAPGIEDVLDALEMVVPLLAREPDNGRARHHLIAEVEELATRLKDLESSSD